LEFCGEVKHAGN